MFPPTFDTYDPTVAETPRVRQACDMGGKTDLAERRNVVDDREGPPTRRRGRRRTDGGSRRYTRRWASATRL